MVRMHWEKSLLPKGKYLGMAVTVKAAAVLVVVLKNV